MTIEQRTEQLKAEAEMLAAMSPHERKLAMRSLMAARTCKVRFPKIRDVRVTYHTDKHSEFDWEVHCWTAECGLISLPFRTQAFALRVAEYMRENDRIPDWAYDNTQDT